MHTHRKVIFAALLTVVVAGGVLVAARDGENIAAKETALAALVPVEPVDQQVPPVPPITVPWARPAIMECYSLNDGQDPNVNVRLTTNNFGGDLVGVRTLVRMCEQGIKIIETAGAPPQTYGEAGENVFACYKTTQGAQINDPFVLTTRNFGQDRVVVVEAIMLCESALKIRTNAAGQTTTFGTLGHVLQCYSVRYGDDVNRVVAVKTNNFGVDKIVVRNLNMMCEEARKDRVFPTPVPNPQPTDPTMVQPAPYGTASGLVWACYTIREGDTVDIGVVLRTQNFGPDAVKVRRGVSMCEIARKTPLYQFPPFGAEPATSAELAEE